MAVLRGCGSRLAGAVYLETPLSPFGRPVEDFLVDPPVLANATARSAMSSVGVHLVPDRHRKTVSGRPLMHVVDVVGAKHYPNVADFVEEVRQHGISRRIARTVDFTGLDRGSRLFLFHPRAHLVNYSEYERSIAKLLSVRNLVREVTMTSEERDHYLRQRVAMTPNCPKHHNSHERVQDHVTHDWSLPQECCAGLWWYDVEGGEWDEDLSTGLMRVRRTIGATTYRAYATPPSVRPDWDLAMFMSVPIARIAVIHARDDAHERIAEGLRGQTVLPVTTEES